MKKPITFSRTLVTAALPYANGYVHLGHCAGAYLPADIYVRFLRMRGESTLFVCGSDEHGVAITISAEKEGVAPQEIIDKYHRENLRAFQKFGMSFDVYSRTSLPAHYETAKEFFLDLYKKGYLVTKEEEQFYDDQARKFLPDRYVEGICPNCGFSGARGDQCDNCGAYYNQIELLSPVSLLSGKTPTVRRTTHWYFRFGAFQEVLEKYVRAHEKDWKENVLAQTKSWLRQGLADRAVTRDLTWGVPVPLENAEGKVMYVWFDAVLGYISATKVWAEEHKKNWEEWWCDEGTRYVAFIGKDNIVFHTLLFPAILTARNEGEKKCFVLPENVPANEFLNLEGGKFSKSRGRAIDLKDFLEEFPADTLRYALAVNLPEMKDADFYWKDFAARVNGELADILGNFVHRALTFAHSKFNGRVPEYAGELTSRDNDLFESVKKAQSVIASCYERFRFREAVLETMNVARTANKYFNDAAPWLLVKNDARDAARVINSSLQLIHSLAVLFAPVIPETSERMFRMLNRKLNAVWDTSFERVLTNEQALGVVEILFEKIEDETIAKQIAKLGSPEKKTVNPVTSQKMKQEISFEDFQKIDLRTAKILTAERVKKSDKLLRLEVDIAGERRQIVAGIGTQYEPEALIGKSVVVVANLAPAKLMGVQSEGMLLAASADGVGPVVLETDATIPTGAVVK